MRAELDVGDVFVIETPEVGGEVGGRKGVGSARCFGGPYHRSGARRCISDAWYAVGV